MRSRFSFHGRKRSYERTEMMSLILPKGVKVKEKNPHGNTVASENHRLCSGFVVMLALLGIIILFGLLSCDSGNNDTVSGKTSLESSSLSGELLAANASGSNKNSGDSGQDLAEINVFQAGAFENPESCAGCHREIYEAWSESKHRYAWVGEFYQSDYLQASQETDGFTDVFCGECHTPSGVRTEQLPPPDGSLLDDTSKKGVSCDYCHTVQEVVEPVNVQTISDPGEVKRGPKGDGNSPYHEVKYSEVHTQAAFCGACHSVEHPTSGASIIDTYEDWKEGPYAEQDTTCQDCHMTPGPGVTENPGKSSPMGDERKHVATHSFPGGSVFFQERTGNEQEAELAKDMLEAAAELELEANSTPEGIELLARVKNVGAGHKIPTGVTYIRKMWLEVTVTNEAGEDIYRSGHVVEDNRIDPDTDFYRVLFRDAQGNLTPKSWVAEEIGYDRRIPAKGQDEQVFEIPVDSGTQDGLNVNVRLLYRSMSQEAADKLDVDVPSIEMTRAELEIN